MVFGWGKKKEHKPRYDASAPQEKEIELSNVKKITEEIRSLRMKTIVSESKIFRDKIESKRSEVLRIAYELEQDNLNVDDIDQHLKMLVLRGKKLVISTIKNEAGKKLGEIKSFDDAKQLNSGTEHMLKKIGIVLGQQSRVIHIFAKKYAGKLKDHLAVMKSDREQLQTLLNNFNQLNEDISVILEKMDSFEQLQHELKDTKNRIEELRASISDSGKQIESINQKIVELKSTKEYSKLVEIKKTIDSLSSEEHDIKNNIQLQFTKISRPLGKYEYVSSLEKPQLQMLRELVSDPYSCLNSKNKDDVITILLAVRKGVESGSVSVKDIDKSVSFIDETIELLDNLILQKTEFTNKKSKLEDGLQIFDIRKLEQKESELNKNLNHKTDSESKIQMLDAELTEMNNKIPHILMDIESKLRSISSTKYHVKV